VPWLRRSVADLSPRRYSFDASPGLVGFVVGALALARVCNVVLRLSAFRTIPKLLHTHISPINHWRYIIFAIGSVGYIIFAIDSVGKQNTVSSNRGWNPGSGKGYSSSAKLPDRPWGPHSFLLNGYRLSLSGIKWPARKVNHHTV
jgi:hypothetical protein